MILTRKRLLVDIFLIRSYQNLSHFASLRALISSPVRMFYFFLLVFSGIAISSAFWESSFGPVNTTIWSLNEVTVDEAEGFL